MVPRRQVLLTDNGALETAWPFTRKRFEEQLSEIADVTHVDVRETPMDDIEWERFHGAALFGGELTEDRIDRAAKLIVVGAITDMHVPSCYEPLSDRGIPFIDATPAWGQSVAECGFGLILSSLRKLPHWHRRVADGEFDWTYPYQQFCDDPEFLNGELGTKTVGIVGLGAIGARIAKWCAAFGSTVLAHDPFVPDERFNDCSAEQCDIDSLVDRAQVLVIAVPPTPSAQKIVNAERVARITQGGIVLTITRTAAIDTQALRERVLANELFWASDVYDVEPLPPDDPIIGRDNVIHVPHIAGRTMDANIRLADILAEDFIRVFKGERPMAVLTPQVAKVRTEEVPDLDLPS